MKPLFSTLVTTSLLLSGSSLMLAQGPGANLAGFVFANAIGITEKADITANGKKLTTNGVSAGIASSGLGLPIGSYQIQVTAPGCEVANTSLQLVVGATPIIIAYLEPVTDPKTKVTKNYIRLLQVPAQPQSEKYLMTAISVDQSRPLSVTAGGQTQTVEFKKPVRFEGKVIKATGATNDSDELTAEEKGSYYCVLFRQANGKIEGILVPQRIYQW